MVFLLCDEIQLTMKPYLLFSREKDFGKTFLLYSIVKDKVKNNENVIFLLGNQFSKMKDPEIIILEELGLNNCTFDEFLDALECKAKINKTRIVIFIDGLEDGCGIKLWNRYFNGFFSKIFKRKSLGLVITIRDTYYTNVAKDNPNRLNISGDSIDNLVISEFNSFDDDYPDSVSLFQFNNIDFVNNYLILSKFNNLNFLMTYFELLKYGNFNNSSNQLERYCEIIDEYLKTINKDFAYKFGYYGDNLIKEVLDDLIEFKAKNLKLSKKDANTIILDTLHSYPNFNFEFLDALVKENILIEMFNTIEIAFPFFEDYKITEVLFRDIDKNNLKNQFDKNSNLYNFITNNGKIIMNNFLEIFSIYIPEKYNIELYELNSEFKSDENVICSFLRSFKWRTNINKEKSLSYIEEYVLNNDYLLDNFFSELKFISTNVNHVFSARDLHKFLFDMNSTKRDLIWTKRVDYGFNEENIFINNIIKFTSVYNVSYYSDEQALLISLLLAWHLTSMNSSFCEDISKSLINLLKDRLHVLLELLAIFEDVNDSQLYTYLYAVAYGCVTLTSDKEHLEELAVYVYMTIFNKEKVYPHILLRDYAQNIIEHAITQDQNIKSKIDEKKIRPPYKSNFPVIPSSFEIEKYKMDNKLIKNIFNEMTKKREKSFMHLFGCYILTATFVAWEKHLLKDNIKISDLINIIVKRIFNLNFSNENKEHNTMRYKKGYFNEIIENKYIWIFYYELLAQIWDEYPISIEEFIEYEKTSNYFYQWNVNIRKFDPTISYSPNSIIDVSQFNKFYETYFNDEKLIELHPFQEIIQPIISINNKKLNGILLEGEYEVHNPFKKKKSSNFKIYSYFIPKNQFSGLIKLIENKRLWELDFFEPKLFFGLYDKEFYLSEKFYRYYNYEKEKYPKSIKANNKIFCLEHTTLHSQLSSDSHNYFLKVHPDLYTHANLNQGIENSFLYDSDEEIVSLDTYEIDNANHNLIFDKDILFDYLEKNELEIFFTVEFNKNNQLYTGLYYFNEGDLIGNITPYSEYSTDCNMIINFKGNVTKYVQSKNIYTCKYFTDKDNQITYAFLSLDINDNVFSSKKLIKDTQKYYNVKCRIYFLSKENKVNNEYYNFVLDNLGEYNDNYLIEIFENCILLVNSSKMNITSNLKSKLFREYIKPLLNQINYIGFTEYPEEPDDAFDYFEYVWWDIIRNFQ